MEIKPVRIGDIEFRKYKSTKVDYPLYEIIKWYENEYYGKLEEYLNNGWRISSDEEMVVKGNVHMSKSFFTERPQHCYVIVFFRINPKTNRFNKDRIGNRDLEICGDDENNYKQILKLAKKSLNEATDSNILKRLAPEKGK